MASKARLGRGVGLALALALLLVPCGPTRSFAQSSATPAQEVLPLGEAIARAREHAPEVVNARRSAERAALSVESAEIALKPSASASATAVGSDGAGGGRVSLSGSGTLGPGVTWNLSAAASRQSGPLGLQGFNDPLSATLSVSVRLWPPGSDGEAWRTLSTRRSELDLALERLAQAQRNAQVSAAEAYGRLAIARARLALAVEAHASAARELDRILDLKARGMVSDADVIRAQITLLEQEGAVINQRENVASLTETLAELVGLPVAAVAELGLEEVGDTGDGWTPPDKHAAMERAIAASTAVMAAARSLESAKESLEVLRREGGASLSVGGSISGGAGDPVDWTVRVDGSYALFDSGAHANRVASAERSVAEAEIALDAAIEEVAKAVETAYRDLASAERSVAIAAATVSLRTREAEIGAEQAARGLISDTALARLERDARSAQLDLENAKLTQRIALMKLKVLLGLDP